MSLDPRLMEILICPDCHGELEEREDPEHVLVCLSCGLHYPVRDGIPVMLVDEAYRPEEQ